MPGALEHLPKLKFIQSLWAGVDKLMLDPTVPIGVPLARMIDPLMNDTMAQTALWAVLSLHREFLDYADQQRAGEWRQHPLKRAEDITVAVLGLGQMGRATAQQVALHGYRVLGWSSRAASVIGVQTHAGAIELEQVLKQAQIVINLLPLTPDTLGLFNADTIAQMRRGASLVNLARGAHVVESDLLAAMDTGHIHRAVLDVFEAEPLPTDHPYWTHPRVTVLPHVAAQTDARSAASIAARNILALREGREIGGLVDRARGY